MKTRIDPAQFGEHIRVLRNARGQTQTQLAHASQLSPDTVRRIERGTMTASLETLDKLAAGLELPLSVVFSSYELGEVNELEVLVGVLADCSPSDVHLILRVAQLVSEVMGQASTR